MNYRIFVNKKSSRLDRINYTNRIGKSSQTKILQILRKYSLKSYSPDKKILLNNAPGLYHRKARVTPVDPGTGTGKNFCGIVPTWLSRGMCKRPYRNPNNQNNVLNKLRNKF